MASSSRGCSKPDSTCVASCATAPSSPGSPGPAEVEVVEGDALQLDTLPPAFAGMDALYYLVHSMGAGGGADFAQQDRHAASNTALVAKEQGVGRIIYLGGLGQEGAGLSEHLASRQETGRALASHGVPVTEFRAAVIVGAGSLSFRMVRYLSERLPVMITPRWVSTRVQPIAEDDVVRYLVDALDVPGFGGTGARDRWAPTCSPTGR